MRTAAATAAVILVTGCGSRHEPLRVVVAKAQTTPPPCTVVVILDDDAGSTRRAVERLALDAKGTNAITFVPASVELAWLVKRHPELGHPTHNGLPDRYEITFDTETHGIAAAERLKRVPQVFQTIGPYDCTYLGQP